MKPYQRVFKLLTRRLQPSGFTRVRSSWWEKRATHIWRRIHIHKFTFANSFRVHAAIHVDGFGKDAAQLNGFASKDGWYEVSRLGFPLRRYDFHFTETPESEEKSAEQLHAFIERCVMPWFEKWKAETKLCSTKDSPLSEEARAFLAKKLG